MSTGGEPLRLKAQVAATIAAAAQALAGNRVVRNSLFSSAGFVVPLVLLLLFTPPLIGGMGVEGYGLWTLALSVLGLMGTLELGLGTAIAKFVAEYHSKGDADGLSAAVSTGLLLQTAIGLLLTCPLYLLAPAVARWFGGSALSLNGVEQAIRLTALALVPVLWRSGGLAVPTGLQRFEIPMVLNVSQRILLLTAALLVVLLGGTVQEAILSTVVVTWSFGLASLAVMFRLLRGSQARLYVSWRYAHEMLSFAAFNGAASIGGQVFGSMDRLAVGAVLGLSGLTYYTVAIGIANKLLYLTDYLTRSLMPATSAWNAAGDHRKLVLYYRRSTAVVVALNVGMAAVLLVASEPFMRLWMGASFAAETVPALRILTIVYMMTSLNAPAYQMANGLGRPWICAVTSLVGGAGTICLIVVLGRTMGLQGAAWANAAYWVTLLVIVYVGHLLSRGPAGTR